jgi:hypothetical protein
MRGQTLVMFLLVFSLRGFWVYRHSYQLLLLDVLWHSLLMSMILVLPSSYNDYCLHCLVVCIVVVVGGGMGIGYMCVCWEGPSLFFQGFLDCLVP